MKPAKTSTAAVSLLLATACSTPVELPRFLRPEAPPSLTAPCPELEAIDVKDMGDLLAVCMDDAALYRQCREKHNALAAWAEGRSYEP